MNAIKKLEEVRAEQELVTLGYEKVKCPKCLGAGWIIAPAIFMMFPARCCECNGDGEVWEKKETK